MWQRRLLVTCCIGTTLSICHAFQPSERRRRNNPRLNSAVSPPDEPWQHTMVTPHTIPLHNRGLLTKTLMPLTGFVLHSLLVAVLLISWEDLTCSLTLPSRHTTSLPKESIITSPLASSWGQSTVHGLAFGEKERLQLSYDDGLIHTIPSYNEVLQQHRRDRVVRWRTAAGPQERTMAVHTLLDCLAQVQSLQKEAGNYQWTAISLSLRSPPLSQLEVAASALRKTTDTDGTMVTGFDWGSCSWRHCGALADSQEALDELEHMTGVLEPYEAIFCLDIVERSLREILAALPWDDPGMNSRDVQRWNSWPVYQAPASSSPKVQGEEGVDRVDDEFLQALRAYRVD